MIANLLLKPVQKAFNQAVASDPDNQALLTPLEGTRFKIILTDLNLTLICEALNDHIQCYMDDDCVCHVSVKGTSLSFLQSALAGSDAASAKKFALHMEGDTHTAQAWQQLFSQLDIDWQALLEPKIGEQPAFHLIKTAKFLKCQAKKAKQQIMQDGAEYLKHEKKLLVPEHFIQQFKMDVLAIQQDTDRLEARIQRLERNHHD